MRFVTSDAKSLSVSGHCGGSPEVVFTRGIPLKVFVQGSSEVVSLYFGGGFGTGLGRCYGVANDYTT